MTLVSLPVNEYSVNDYKKSWYGKKSPLRLCEEIRIQNYQRYVFAANSTYSLPKVHEVLQYQYISLRVTSRPRDFSRRDPFGSGQIEGVF